MIVTEGGLFDGYEPTFNTPIGHEVALTLPVQYVMCSTEIRLKYNVCSRGHLGKIIVCSSV